MKICILGNQARSVYLFWRVLMQHMLAEGHTVFCLLPGGDATTEESIKQLGVRVVNYRLDRKGINPLRDVVTFLDLKRVLGKERPDLLFATTIKPVIYGCMAAKLVRIPHIYATITGLGYAFEAGHRRRILPEPGRRRPLPKNRYSHTLFPCALRPRHRRGYRTFRRRSAA